MRVTFKMNGKTDEIALTPQNARTLVVEGNIEFLSYIGSRLMNPIENNVAFKEKSFVDFKDSIQQISAFLKLVKRKSGIELYILNDEKRINFFYRLPGQKLVELRYKKTAVGNNINEMAGYRQQLNNLFADLTEKKNLTSSLESLKYKEDDLSFFLESLFPGDERKLDKKGHKAQWIVSAGVALNIVNLQDSETNDEDPQSYAPSLSPLVSVGLLVPLGRNFGNFFFYPQLKLFRYKNSGEYKQGALTKRLTYQTDLAVIAKVASGINIINKGSHKVFIIAGAGMLMQRGAKQVKEGYPGLDTQFSGDKELTKRTYSFDLSAGVELNKKIHLSTNYLIPSDIGSFALYSPTLSGIHLSISYKL